MPRLLAIFVVTAFLIGHPASAQQPGCDPGHANATININGKVPGPGSNDINVENDISLGINIDNPSDVSSVILIAGVLGCGALPTPWGGSIDMSSGTVLVDGFGRTVGPLDTYAQTPFSLSVGTTHLATTSCIGAVQAILTDATNAPIQLRNTMAIRLCGQDLEAVHELPDDGFVLHQLSSSQSINFCGNNYTELFINSNGFITFDHGSDDFTPLIGTFFGGIGGGPNPTVAVAWGDLNPISNIPVRSTYAVREDASSGVTVEFRNQYHWDQMSPEPAGNFTCNFAGTGTTFVTLDLTGFIPATTLTGSYVVGVSDGDGSVGIDTDLSDGLGTGIANARGSYVSPSGQGGDSIGETIPPNTAIGFGVVTFHDPFNCEYSIL